jgi:nicotinamidase-related amidase
MASKNTALLLVDPYNDFLHEEGKLYQRLEESIKASDTTTHLFEAVKAAREGGVPIFYCMHQQTTAHTFRGWSYLNASQRGLGAKMVFEEGSFGAGFFAGLEPDLAAGDVVVSKHWNSRCVLFCFLFFSGSPFIFIYLFRFGFLRKKER